MHMALIPTMGGMEWAIIGFVALLVFGNRLPSVARSLGGSFSSFKRGLKDTTDGLDEVKSELRDVTRSLESAAREGSDELRVVDREIRDSVRRIGS